MTITVTNNFIQPPTAVADFYEIFLNIAHYLLTELPRSFLPSGFPNKILYTFISPMHNTRA